MLVIVCLLKRLSHIHDANPCMPYANLGDGRSLRARCMDKWRRDHETAC